MNETYFFVSKPRCSSTTLCDILCSKENRTKYIHETALQMIPKIGIAKWNNSFSFAIVRNPYDLIKSWYCHHKMSVKHRDTHVGQFYPENINDWVLQGCNTHWNYFHINPLDQYKWIYSGTKLLVKKIYKLENYEYMVNDLSEILNIDKELLLNEKRNSSNSSDVQLSEEAKQYIRQRFINDFRLFGY